MRLTADGATPIPRSLLVAELETDDGHAFELTRPLFLAAGDRIGFEGDGLIVVRPCGERLTVDGGWSTRCRGRAGRA
jgi:urease accessory protein UreE